MTRNARGTLAAMVLGALGAISTVSAQDISTKELLDGLTNPSRWLTHSGDYAGHRFSPLKEITPANASQLAAQWTFQTGVNKLFTFQTGAAIFAPPTSYAIDGRQYVVIPSGATLTSFALPAPPGRAPRTAPAK